MRATGRAACSDGRDHCVQGAHCSGPPQGPCRGQAMYIRLGLPHAETGDNSLISTHSARRYLVRFTANGGGFAISSNQPKRPHESWTSTLPSRLKLYRSRPPASSGNPSVGIQQDVSAIPRSRECTGRDIASPVRLANAGPACAPGLPASSNPTCTISSARTTADRVPRTRLTTKAFPHSRPRRPTSVADRPGRRSPDMSPR